MAKRKRLRVIESQAEYQNEPLQNMQSQRQPQENLQHDSNTVFQNCNQHVEELDHLDQENVGHEEGDAVTVEGILLDLITLQ